MYFEVKLKDIPTSLISQKDTFFHFTDEDPSVFARLKSSITTVGIMSPIMIQRWQKGCFRIVSGFMRLWVAKELNLVSVPVRILREDLSAHQVLTVLLSSHLWPLSLTEKARIVQMMICLGLSPSEIVEDFGSFLGISSLRLIKAYVQLSQYNHHVLSYISAYGLSLKQALAFEGLSSQEQELLAFLAGCLSLKGYDVSCMVAHLKEIATREVKKVSTIIEETGILNIQKETPLTRSQRVTKIKEILKGRRYPKLTQVNKRLSGLRKNLRFASHLQLSWDQDLEGAIRLSLTLGNSDDIRKAIDDLSRAANYTLLSRFLEVYYEGVPDT